MDFYLNKINAYYKIDNLPWYTDCDSLIVHKNCSDLLKDYLQDGKLGMLSFDI